MKIFITIGTTNGSLEGEFDVADNEFATYLGLEIPSDDEEKVNGRETILRLPFVGDGLGINTLAAQDATIRELEEVVDALKDEVDLYRKG